MDYKCLIPLISRQFIPNAFLWLGVSFSLLWGIAFSSLPMVQKLELKTQDFLMRITPAPDPSQEILLIKIREQNLKEGESLEDPIFYAHLVERLLQGGAEVIILNLHSNWLQKADHDDNPIKQLLRKHHDRLVLVLPTTCLCMNNPARWRTYNYFIPTQPDGKALFPVNSILGFSEYEPEEHEPSSLSSPSRRAYLVGNFNFSNNFNGNQKLDAAVFLGFKKFSLLHNNQKLPIRIEENNPIQIHFWAQDELFPSINLETISSEDIPVKQVRNKIVLLGFVGIEDSNSYSIHSPFGETISKVEFQANFLSSLLTNQFYFFAPQWLSGIILIGGGVAVSEFMAGTMGQRRFRGGYQYKLTLAILLSLGILNFWLRLIFPLILFLITWVATGFSVILSILFAMRENLIQQQRIEIARLKSVEQDAVICQARKLLNRISANIHDGPLQELKLIMDALEILQRKHPNLNTEPILEQVETMGNHLRQQINHTRTRTLSLQITPELRKSLANGIETKLQELVASGQLKIIVETKIDPLREPVLNSIWIGAREEIFCFFCEAITNVIRHAQPPNGTASKLAVTLSQQDDQCALIIENDKIILEELVLNNSSGGGKKGGYGTKLMENIASELPGGFFKRVTLEDGGMRVILTWNLSF